MIATSPPVPGRTLIVSWIAAALACGIALLLPAVANATERTANPSTFSRVFAAAKAGDTIKLATGDYGTFHGAMKPGRVRITRQPGARVTMSLEFKPAANITIGGVTLRGAYMSDSRTRNITIQNSNVPGQVVLDTRSLQNSNIVLTHNDFHDFDKCGNCGEGRVFLPGETNQLSGITIRNSEFRGGLSDGIQDGSRGTRIINNEFHDIILGTPEGVHSDAIQLLNSERTVIRGNYFHDLDGVPPIMAPDGAERVLIEDNVISGDFGYPYITLFSDNSSIVRHNTFADGNCGFNQPCGILRLGTKSSSDPGHGTIIDDNILAQISIEPGASVARRSHNLLAHGSPSGRGEIRGLPKYVGGVNPASYNGYRLRAGSLGLRKASDGLNIGARISP